MSRTMTTLTSEQMNTLTDLAEQYDGQVRSYSGRGMYGQTCLGITIDGDLIGFVMQLAACLTVDGHFNLAESLAAQACTDSMGRGSIVYFSCITAPADIEDEDEDEEDDQ